MKNIILYTIVILFTISCTPEETCFETVTRYYDTDGEYLYSIEGFECETYK